jgi:hypothetical protein
MADMLAKIGRIIVVVSSFDTGYILILITQIRKRWLQILKPDIS